MTMLTRCMAMYLHLTIMQVWDVDNGIEIPCYAMLLRPTIMDQAYLVGAIYLDTYLSNFHEYNDVNN